MGNVVGFSEFQKRFEAECLFQRVNVLALQVFDALRFDCLSIAEFDDTNRNTFEFGQFGRSEAARACDHLIIAFVQFANQKRREYALALEAGCEFTETAFIKSLAWVARRLNESRHWHIAVFGVLYMSLHVKFSF